MVRLDATNSGEVEFDTIGSVDDVAGVTNLATYMGSFHRRTQY